MRKIVAIARAMAERSKCASRSSSAISQGRQGERLVPRAWKYRGDCGARSAFVVALKSDGRN